MIKFDPERIPQPVTRLADILGPEPLYAVGGIIRDSILKADNLEPPIRTPAGNDWDFATPLRPDEVMKRLRKAGITAVPIGIEHGTVAAVIDKTHYEITTFRHDLEYTDGRHPVVRFADDITEDLKRRDFTVNAFALNLQSMEVLDLFNGLEDLNNRVIRTVGNPDERFNEDYLRMLRAARFAARLEGIIGADTFAAMRNNNYKILRISAERIRDELMKMLTYTRPSIGFERLHESGLLLYILPELEMGFGVGQNRFHADDVARHTLHTVDCLSPRHPFDRWCALLHDLGKATHKFYKPEKQDYVFYGHQYASKRMGQHIMKRLRFSNREIIKATAVVENHMYDLKPDLSEAATRRFLRKLGRENVPSFLRVRLADRLGNRNNEPGYEKGVFHFVRTLRAIERAEDALSIRDLAITGNDLKAMGLTPGPIFSQILDALLDEVLDKPQRNNREYLLGRARDYAEQYKMEGRITTPARADNEEENS